MVKTTDRAKQIVNRLLRLGDFYDCALNAGEFKLAERIRKDREKCYNEMIRLIEAGRW